MKRYFIAAICALILSATLTAQKYNGLIDKTVAVIGNEMIPLSEIEGQIQAMRAQGQASDRSARCELLEQMMESKLYLMQARLDSLEVNKEMVSAQLSDYVDRYRTALGGDEELEAYFHKPLYKLRQEWQKQIEEQSLVQQEQQQIAAAIPELTPFDVKQYLDTAQTTSLPVVPQKYQMSQICLYPDKEAAAMAVKERLLSLRERIINGEKFSTLARIYSEDTESAKRGGELGMASKTIFVPAFADAAMSLKPGTISQIVESQYGYHIIEVIEKKGDMFNARHILLKPQYTIEDQEKAFTRLDSLRTAISVDSLIQFETAARFYSEDYPTRTNGGQMADPYTGSAYFVIDQLNPQDYAAIKDLSVGQISEPIESLDSEGNVIYKIIRLDKIVPAHTANFDNDYTELLGLVKERKQMEAISKFVDDKIDITYIVIDPLFSDCDFSRKGWSSKFRKD